MIRYCYNTLGLLALKIYHVGFILPRFRTSDMLRWVVGEWVSSPPIYEVRLLYDVQSERKKPQIGIVAAHCVVMT